MEALNALVESKLSDAPALLGVSVQSAEGVVVLNRTADGEAPTDGESNTDESNTDESNTGEPNTDESNTDEPNTTEPNTAESNAAESLADAPEAAPQTIEKCADGDDADAPVRMLAAANGVEKAGPTKPMLQAQIDDALTAVSGALAGRVQVVLKKNTSYEGDIKIQVGDRKVLDNFELELCAEDAGTSGMDGGGTTAINGNLTIFGIKVIMNSVMIGSEKVVTVQNRSDSTKEENRNKGGELTYIGSKNAPNEASYVVGNKSSATISATDDDDSFTVTTLQGAKSVSISTGDGIDTVNLTMSGGKADVSTGFGDDKVNLQGRGAGRRGRGHLGL